MPIPKIEITNPQALELLAKIKSGEFTTPLIAWLKKNRLYLTIGFIALILLVAIGIAVKISRGTPVPTFTPPVIETPITAPETVVKSAFSPLRQEIKEMNTDLPDPAIPTFDNNIDLEPITL